MSLATRVSSARPNARSLAISMLLHLLLYLLLNCIELHSGNPEESGETNVTMPSDSYPLAPSVTQESSPNATVEDETVTVEDTFPLPSMHLVDMINAAKEFLYKYLSTSEWLNMKKLLRVIKEIGGKRRDTHRAVSIYLGRVLSREEREEIKSRKEELDATFGGDFRHR